MSDVREADTQQGASSILVSTGLECNSEPTVFSVSKAIHLPSDGHAALEHTNTCVEHQTFSRDNPLANLLRSLRAKMTESSPPPKAYTPTLLSRCDASTSNSSLSTLPGAEATSFLEASEQQRDIEKCETIKPLEKQMKHLSSFQFVGWMIVNTLATIGIVSNPK